MFGLLIHIEQSNRTISVKYQLEYKNYILNRQTIPHKITNCKTKTTPLKPTL